MRVSSGDIATVSRHGGIRNIEDVPAVTVPRSHNNGNLQGTEFQISYRERYADIYLDARHAL